MRTLLASFSVALAAAALWQVTHCPVNGGVCQCSQPSWVFCFVPAVIAGALACYPDRKRTEQCN